MAQTLQSVSQALKILELLQRTPSLGVSEIAALLEVSSSTAHRLLSTMADADFVRQGPVGRKYQLGPAMQISRNASLIEHCIEVSTPHMIALRDESSETVHLAVLTRTETRFVAAFESPLIMRVTSRVGRELPAHTTAAGKILLARLDSADFAERYPEEELTAGTAESIHSTEQLRLEVLRAGELGYARNSGESESGVAAIAVPLRHPDGLVTCSLTLTGPESRFNPTRDPEISAREAELLSMLQATARTIESELRY